MPFGPEPLGFAYFAGVKLAGYSAYAAVVNRSESIAVAPVKKFPSFWIGLVRTLIGVSVGAAFGFGFWSLAKRFHTLDPYSGVLFFGLLLPVRVLEWLLLWNLFYRRLQLSSEIRRTYILVGILISFLLDAVGIMAVLVIPGGAWIC